MQTTKKQAIRIFFLCGERLSIIFVLISFFILFFTQTSMKVYSKSTDVMFHQESIYLENSSKKDVYSSASKISNQSNTTLPVVSISFETAKITPTPTIMVVDDSKNDDIWMRIAECESHQNWKDDTGNGYYGGLQFSLGAWASVGGSGKPSDASKDEQIMRGKMLQAVRGWGAWGACSKKLALQ